MPHEIDSFSVPFYEARPVKPEICLIGSTGYPSFHEGNLPLSAVGSINLCDNTYPLSRVRSPKRRPGCCRANQNKLQTSYSISPFPTSKVLRRRADEKTNPIRTYDLQLRLPYHTMVDHRVTSPSTSPAMHVTTYCPDHLSYPLDSSTRIDIVVESNQHNCRPACHWQSVQAHPKTQLSPPQHEDQPRLCSAIV